MADLDVSLRLRLVNMLSGPAKVAEKDLQRLLKATGKRVGNRSSDRYAKDIERVGRAAKGASRDVEKLGSASGRMRDASGRFTAAANGARKLGDEAARAAKQVDRLAQATKRVKSPPGLGGKARDAKGRFVSGTGQAAAGGIGAGEAALGGAAAARLGAGGLMKLLPGVAAGAGGVAAGKNQLDFGRVMFEVEKATDASGDALKRYEATIRTMALETGKTKEELGQMMAAAGFAGRPVKELDRFTRYAAASTLAWGTTAEQTGQALAEIGNIYKANQARIEEIGDAINAVADKSASKETDLMEFVRRSGGQANMLGLSAERTLAFGAALKEVGVQSEVAATGFNALLTKLTTFDETDEDFTKALKAAGINAKTFKKALVKDAGGAITQLLEGLNKIQDPLKKMEAFKGIGGGEYADDFMRLAGSIDRIRELFTLMGDRKNYVGSTMQQFAKAQEKDFNRVDRSLRAITEAGNTMMAGPVKAVGALAEEFNKFAAATQEGENSFQKFAAYLDGRYPGLIDQAQRFAAAAGRAVYEGLKAGQLEGGSETADDARKRGELDRWRAGLGSEIAAEQDVLDRGHDARSKSSEMRRRAQELRDAAPGKGRSQAARSLADAARLDERANEVEAALAPLQSELDKQSQAIHLKRERLERQLELTQRAIHGEGLKNFGFGEAGRKDVDPEDTHGTTRDDTLRMAGQARGPRVGGGIIGGANAFPMVAGSMEQIGTAATGVQKALDAAAQAATKLEGELSQDLSSAADKSMGGFNAALKAQGDQAIQTAQRIKQQLESILGSISATPTITPRLSLPPAGGKPPGPGKRAEGGGRSAPRGGISIAKVEITGVRDMASLERQLTAAADRKARSSFSGALHDTA